MLRVELTYNPNLSYYSFDSSSVLKFVPFCVYEGMDFHVARKRWYLLGALLGEQFLDWISLATKSGFITRAPVTAKKKSSLQWPGMRDRRSRESLIKRIVCRQYDDWWLNFSGYFCASSCLRRLRLWNVEKLCDSYSSGRLFPYRAPARQPTLLTDLNGISSHSHSPDLTPSGYHLLEITYTPAARWDEFQDRRGVEKLDNSSQINVFLFVKKKIEDFILRTTLVYVPYIYVYTNVNRDKIIGWARGFVGHMSIIIHINM